ncbi:hypothetical protein V502_09647 [Pseudogymnoascus sp. VKM F-4520 (FW-2644)]|nr:hypothetical protein V502_09647 [Pseudogymnoascus sp. VKM F-4520 (FW-2644)]
MASPTKESFSSLAPSSIPAIQAPPSPRTHRTLRRLNSAHTLGSSKPSLISQQRLQQTTQNQSLRPKDQPPLPTTHVHQRTRSNSDVTTVSTQGTGLAGRKQISTKKPAGTETFSLDRLIREGPDRDLTGALDSTRLKILDQGIKSDSDGMASLHDASLFERTDAYLVLVHRGASPAYSKIRNDTFRTLATDPLFRRRVSEASLIRLLNAVAWRLHDAKESRIESASSASNNSKVTHTATADGSPELHSATPVIKNRARALTLTTEGSDAGTSEPGTYVQGMNVLAAPFLYAARSESEAFVAFHRFITHEVPGYVRGAMSGVHKGLALVDKVLSIVDPKLSLYLMGKGMHAELYAFPSVLTLCACTPPLPEVLRLWDFLFAYGAHLNILCIVAQLVMLRNSILSSPSPTKILRSFPPLQAETIKELTLTLIKKIPDDVYAEIVAHAL